jgi:hypothetical protein
MPDQKKQPAFVMMILALFGLFSLPQLLKSPDGGSAGPGPEASFSTTSTVSTDADHADVDDDVRDLTPLIDYLWHGKSRPSTKDKLPAFLHDRLFDTDVYCLIATVPDPVGSVVSGRFDEYLDVIQRAIELQGYVLDRSLIPWKADSSEKSAPADSVTKLQVRGKDTAVSLQTAGPPQQRKDRRPGLMVFKHLVSRKNDAQLKPPSVLLTFLVPESPISGIERPALVASLELIDTYFRNKLTHDEANDKSFLHIIAPCFNSSQRSLETAITGWQPPQDHHYHLRIISSSAGLINQDRLQKILGRESPHTLTFSSMVHEAKDLKDAIIEYLDKWLGYTRSDIAVLVESNSGLAQALVQDERKKGVTHEFGLELMPPLHDRSGLPATGNKRIILAEIRGTLHFRIFNSDGKLLADQNELQLRDKLSDVKRLKTQLKELWPAHKLTPKEKYNVISGVISIFDQGGPPVEFLFPLQVAKLRSAYAKADAAASGKSVASAAPQRLTIPPNEAGAPRDLPRTFTPATSAALDEMALTQVLTTIGRRPYQAVGVVATDPFDVAFLAGEVGQFCPNVRLFTVSSDLVLARAAGAADLRGMLVASTYPLYPSNQWITTPFRDGPRVFFSSRGAQGLYNATVAHLWEMSADEPDDLSKPSSPQLLEFGRPYEIDPAPLHQPPVWISAVGERGLYPITVINPKEQTPFLYDPRTAPEHRSLAQWPSEKPAAQPGAPSDLDDPEVESAKLNDAKADAANAMRPNPFLLFWLVCLFLFFACLVIAYITWHYVIWSTDKQKYKRRSVFAFRWLRHILRWLNCEVAIKDSADRDVDPRSKIPLGGRYDPQSWFHDPQTNPFPPPSGAGINVALLNVIACAMSWYILSHVIVGLSPISGVAHPSSIPTWLTTAVLAVISASTAISMLECVVRRPENEAAAGLHGVRGPRYRFLPSVCLRNGATIIWFACLLLATIAAAALVIRRIPTWPSITIWRLSFERFTSLPSGLSPVFPVVFLAVAFVAWVYSQLAWRRLYRLSYLPSSEKDSKRTNQALHIQEILIAMRKNRGKVDRLLSQWWVAVARANPALWCVVAFLIVHMMIRFASRRLPGSFEGPTFDRIFWTLFMIAFAQVIIRTLQLTSLWRSVRKTLHLAVELPLSSAYDRIPTRFKSWFFGEDDFTVREQVIRQQSTAVGNRITTKLVGIFDTLLVAFAAEGRPGAFPCEPGITTEQAEIATGNVAEIAAAAADAQEVAPANSAQTCRNALEKLRGTLTTSETLDSTREVYLFLAPLWESSPVKDVARGSQPDAKRSDGADWLGSWPLTPEQSKALTNDQLAILRDWARMAEDLIALQIVRWFAPTLSHLLPMMQYVVLASISLLLVVTSYPFDHQGWLTTMMVCLIVLVGSVVAFILVGVNRDELISRVADTAPGLTMDSTFVSSLLTMVAPLVAALVAVSFDLSDLIRTWLGPLLPYF